VAVRETGDKIQILDQNHDSLAIALERALERFGTYLHFDGNQAGARTLVDIVVTHDLRVTFTDDRLNAQIQLRRIQNDLDRGRSIATSEQEQTVTQKIWVGFYTYSGAHDKHRMDLGLDFANGRVSGEGNDDVGAFVISGRFDSAKGECDWTKPYIGAHDVFYRGLAWLCQKTTLESGDA